MKRIEGYLDFINEEFFKKLRKNSKKTKNGTQQSIDEIIKFLNDNGIYDWNDFMKSSPFDRDVVNKIIDKTAINMKELQEIRFGIRLELSDTPQLKEYLKELELAEEYEKCAKVLKKLNR
jgi:hypothetical protein